MDKFSKIISKKKEVAQDTVKYDDGNISIINFKTYSMVREKDMIVCIPYLVEHNQILINQEYVPTYKYIDKNDYHLCVISGSIEEGETPEQCLLRELQEEVGMVIKPEVKIEFHKPLFVSKGNTAKYYPCILMLADNQYSEVMIKGDGTKTEEKNHPVKVNVQYINSLNPSDVITQYLLNVFKKMINI